MTNFVSTYFSPDRGTADVIIGFIQRCQSTIDVAVYSITHDGIADALIEAHNRGIKVRVIMDSLQAAGKYSDDERLEAVGIEVRRDRMSGSLHHKFCIDGTSAVGTGSFNWTKNADSQNAENWNIIRLKYTVETYQKEFNELWATNSP